MAKEKTKSSGLNLGAKASKKDKYVKMTRDDIKYYSDAKISMHVVLNLKPVLLYQRFVLIFVQIAIHSSLETTESLMQKVELKNSVRNTTSKNSIP